MKKVTSISNSTLLTQAKPALQNFITLFSSRVNKSSFSSTAVKNTLKGLNKKNAPKIVFPLVLFFVGAFIVASFVRSTSSENVQGTQDQKIVVKPALKTAEVNREFSFPITDSEGELVGNFNYIIESAELKDEIIVQGKRATSVEGRVFMIVNIKIVNNIEQGIQINSRDFIRLSVNGTDERIAPDIHNDPVEAQAIATKYTRVGFAINTSDTDHTLYIGEIKGEKTSVPLEFK